MIVNVEFMSETFKKYNDLYFDGVLVAPIFETYKAKSPVGVMKRKKHYHANGKPYYEFKIGMSLFYDRPVDDCINTMLHEMCHLYVRQYLKDFKSQHHATPWKRVADMVTRKSGGKYPITIYADTRNSKTNDSVARKGFASTDEINICLWEYSDTYQGGSYIGKWGMCLVNDKYVEQKQSYFARIGKSFCKRYVIGTVRRGDGFQGFPLCRTAFRGNLVSAANIQSYLSKLIKTNIDTTI